MRGFYSNSVMLLLLLLGGLSRVGWARYLKLKVRGEWPLKLAKNRSLEVPQPPETPTGIGKFSASFQLPYYVLFSKYRGEQRVKTLVASRVLWVLGGGD